MGVLLWLMSPGAILGAAALAAVAAAAGLTAAWSHCEPREYQEMDRAYQQEQRSRLRKPSPPRSPPR